jgi:hypothetical protein
MYQLIGAMDLFAWSADWYKRWNKIMKSNDDRFNINNNLFKIANEIDDKTQSY